MALVVGAVVLDGMFTEGGVTAGVGSDLQPLPQVVSPVSDAASGDVHRETTASPGTPAIAPASPATSNAPVRIAPTPVRQDSNMGVPRTASPELAAEIQMSAVAPSARVESIPYVSIAQPSDDGIYPIVAGDPRYSIARWQFDIFQDESNALHADYSSIRAAPTPERLKALEARWYEVTSRIYNTPLFTGVDFLALREIELAISRSWRDYLSIHAEGLRTGNTLLIERAFVHLAFTRHLETLLPQFVR
jgi:hypothetical protein